MSGEEVAAVVAAKDSELLDWMETDVIAITTHPLGWEILWTDDLNEQAHPDPVLIEGKSFREVLAIAKERQAAEVPRDEFSDYLDIPDSQLRPGGSAQ